MFDVFEKCRIDRGVGAEGSRDRLETRLESGRNWKGGTKLTRRTIKIEVAGRLQVQSAESSGTVRLSKFRRIYSSCM